MFRITTVVMGSDFAYKVRPLFTVLPNNRYYGRLGNIVTKFSSTFLDPDTEEGRKRNYTTADIR